MDVRGIQALSRDAPLPHATVLLRLPQLLSPDLIPDSDESGLGLMAMCPKGGKALPVFFVGQSYTIL